MAIKYANTYNFPHFVHFIYRLKEFEMSSNWFMQTFLLNAQYLSPTWKGGVREGLVFFGSTSSN